ncbi:MAG TPA: nickel pincer cofactor biosynthesis protein LarC [Methanocella sp.]|uniref:nickel pincer cofactor biosynthesis protein LarC n=1 Tax=Methanocella sp. TaxID=2052833 RepID=UPI002C375A7E|nr:nickel pincer cofactor biosynthesis protein LarC [Methanocella sp.]HTY91092.1 nickel pincer cofactor biosynthesis protein LarC [Methanocella sp.]
MKIIYLDCFSGISGDMFLGAMVDMGIPIGTLASGLYGLGLDIRLDVKKVRKHGIAGTKLDVIAPDTAHERHLSDILEIIDASALESDIKAASGNIFRRLAEAEAKVHGISAEEVHFHEVGALDTIADVVGAAICYKASGAEALFSSPVNVGSGFVKTSHGLLPVPAPATLELLKGASIYSTGIQSELVTPTGAAILAGLCGGYGPMPYMTAEKTGYGAGTKDLEAPNLLRAVLGEKIQKKA